MSRALYRKYRSKSLDEVIGQKHITDILSRSIASGHISHAYLLTGPRGVGKTSVARIIAHQINELEYDEDRPSLDIIEIDAASNNGVEDVRDLREKVQIAPFSAVKKIYIIDEVHMLSKAAFNALLKTLEEPPKHVIFILATTNIEKLPSTIVSRTQRFSFRPITIEDAVAHLKNIAKKEKIKISSEALHLIAERSDGSFRDSISLLDQLSSLADKDNEINVELIEDMLGLAPSKTIDQILNSIESKNIKLLVSYLKKAFDDGNDVDALVDQLNDKIKDQISEKPQLILLLDSLIDVPKSPQPQLKLLSVLALAATPKNQSKTAALLIPTLEVSASIKELEEQAMLDKPVEKKKVIVSDSNKLSQKLDWSKLIEYTKQNYIALYSVLLKCSYIVDGNKLTLYTNSKFYKKKLDDVKYTSLLSKCLQETGVYGLDIHIIPTAIPSSNRQVATIADIMGGGEEVSLEAM